jgi:hypothetical protein
MLSMLRSRRIIGNKGIVLAFMMFAGLGLVLSVIVFLLFFQYHITLYVQDQYNWNRYQEVPLSFISASPDGKCLPAEASKVFHSFVSPDDFKKEITEFPRLFDQCYYFDVSDGKQKIEWQDVAIDSCSLNERIFEITYPYPLSVNPDSLLGNVTIKIFPLLNTQPKEGPNTH